MKAVLLLLTALCCIAMAQEQKLPETITGQTVELPADLQALRAARIAGYIEQMRSFAEKAAANPSLIESVAKEARAKVMAGNAADVVSDRQARMAEQLYGIQEEFGLQAAVRVARIMASLPTASKGPIIITPGEGTVTPPEVTK